MGYFDVENVKPQNLKDVFPKFFHIVRGLASHVVDFNSCDSDEPWSQVERPEAALELSNTVSSRVKESVRGWLRETYGGGDPEFHKPVLDIDHRCLLLDSSTPGHHHLIIDVEIEWEKYEKLLTVLAECGIIQEGYAGASIERHGSYIRVPWVKE